MKVTYTCLTCGVLCGLNMAFPKFININRFWNQVEDDLEKVKNASSQSELLDTFRQFGRNAVELIQQAAKRQAVCICH